MGARYGETAGRHGIVGVVAHCENDNDMLA
jgi:hypothetical protein